jgi:hypothetical protein
VSLNALAFNWSLQPEEIQSAFSLGQTSYHEELATFLKKYQHKLEYPSNKPHAFAQLVEFQTPYEQIVLKSQQRVGYSRFQAAEDYRANPRLVIVRVIVTLAYGYAGPAPAADSFKVTVSQADSIQPRNVAGRILCDPYDGVTSGTCATYMREIDLDFDARQFAAGSATIKIALPDESSQETKFNLDELK